MILILGSKGQLGKALCLRLSTENFSFIASDRQSVDICNKQQVANFISFIKPKIIINTAAFTNTIRAEKDKDLAKEVNADSIKYICEAANCQKDKPFIIHISTDYVFNGLLNHTFGYIESDTIDPINYYGKSKAAGEVNLYNNYIRYFIIRTSWLFGEYGNNFVKKIVKKIVFDQHDAFVVNDQFGSPTSANTLAKIICLIIKYIMTNDNTILDTENKYGIYHFSSMEYMSYYDFACIIRSYLLLNICSEIKNIYPTETNNHQTIIKRPKNSFLNCKKIKDFLKLKNPDFIWRTECNNILSNMLKNIHF